MVAVTGSLAALLKIPRGTSRAGTRQGVYVQVAIVWMRERGYFGSGSSTQKNGWTTRGIDADASVLLVHLAVGAAARATSPGLIAD